MNSRKEIAVSIETNYQQYDDNKLFRLKKLTKVCIVPGESLFGKDIKVQTNYSSENDFIRTKFYDLEWKSRHGEKLSSDYANVRDLQMYCEINFVKSGSYKVQVIEKDNDKICGSLYCQIEPDIQVGKEKTPLKLESIRCQSVLTKCLGPFTTWEEKLKVTKESGYNLIHFTPVQELAGSRSAYSLKDQLKIDPMYGKIGYEDIGKLVKKMREEWEIASICDIVLNHTGNESQWLQEHPEATYSCFTCPHLRPSFMLDILLTQIGDDVKKGNLELCGVPTVIENEDHIQALKYQIYTQYLPKLKIEEFYQINVEKYFNMFVDALRNREAPTKSQNVANNSLKFNDTKDFKRLNVTIDFDECLKLFNTFLPECYDEDSRSRKCSELFRNALNNYNESVKREVDDCINAAVNNALAGVRYERIQHDGPKFREISYKFPLFTPYFTHTGTEEKSLTEIEEMVQGEQGKFFMAHNGWVMGQDPLVDFAKSTVIGNVYLRRELIAWGDSVKLRFGDKPEDSPYLWERMKEYVDNTAKYFDGVRLDNCHSTPLHVAEYLIDSARKVNPNLYVVAELFTNSPECDNIFVNRLGITSLIREAMSAWDSHEMGRLVYLYGGEPIGSFFNNIKRPLMPGIAHAIFFDQTHDNPSYHEKRSVIDQIPSAAIVSMACCATGSNRGFDELIPHHIHVVSEERQYQAWEKEVDETTGIVQVKRLLNDFHGQLGINGFNQVFVDQMHHDIVAITRHNPITRESYILVAHSSFNYQDNKPTGVRPLIFEGELKEIPFEIDTEGVQIDRQSIASNFKKNEKVINGVSGLKINIRKNINLAKSKIFENASKIIGDSTQLTFTNLRPGSVVAVKVVPHNHVTKNLQTLNNLINQFETRSGDEFNELLKIIQQINFQDFNLVLFSCDHEERDRGFGYEAYNIPNFKRLEYAGLQGVLSLIEDVSRRNDLGHPLCNNLRDGNWMIDYVSSRLTQSPGTIPLSKWIKSNLETLKNIPRYLIPTYFDKIITGVYDEIIENLLSRMPDYISKGSCLPQLLAVASLQFLAPVKSSRLPKMSPFINDPKPPELCTTIAAGLEHFATGYMRSWGRDTFISLRGLTFLTGRFDEARYIILAFAGTMRHGLIPNLLSSEEGRTARFNCRDAVWFWMYFITLYCQEAPNGEKILSEKVARLFPKDESEPMPADGKNDQNLFDVIQEALNVHFQGLVFRERNAGKAIDEHMTNNGFNNQIGINPETGFVFGGNDANCGTWMDKMGSSMKAKNKGIPSSPRDGSAIELVGLQFAVLKYLNESTAYPYKSVSRKNPDGATTEWTFDQWMSKMKTHFEDKFFVSPTTDNHMVNKRNIYKDSLNSSRGYTDFQLRCNFPIAMTVAPDLFTPENAWKALEIAKSKLLGPLGMKTLDPDDWNYRADYDNSNDGDDPTVANGFNYHQGPEWVWPIGYFLRARLIFAKKLGKLKEVENETWRLLSAHLKELRSSPWRGLPELTNSNGKFCYDSCRTQAWSIATILEAVYDLEVTIKK